MPSKGIYLNDSIHGLIPLTSYEKRIISTVGFNRLHDVYQNSTVYLTFPTNRTKRFEHSVGTMKLCSDMFYYSIANSSEDTLNEFFEKIKEECEGIKKELQSKSEIREAKLAGRPVELDALNKIKIEGLRLLLIPRNVAAKNEVLYLLLVQAVRVAALLHDIGHPPFSHIVENALKTVLDEYLHGRTNSKGRAIDEFIDVMLCKGKNGEVKKPLHEQMGDEISYSIMYEVIPNTITDNYAENVFDLIVMFIVEKIFHEKGYFGYLHRIIDSSIDGDRLDYVSRDPINSGMPVGHIDYHRIIDDMKLVIMPEPPDNIRKPFFCIPMKAVNAVEDFLRRRHAVYKNIIYHHRVIKTDCLLEYSVKDLVKIHISEMNASSAGIKNMSHEPDVAFGIQGLWAPMNASTTYEKSNALSGWDDSWLITVLKHIFYSKYYNDGELVLEGKADNSAYLLSHRLSELLLHKKVYYSLIKRNEDFKTIDNTVKSELKKEKRKIIKKIEESNLVDESGRSVPTKGILGTVNDLFDNKLYDEKTLVMSYIDKHNSAASFMDLEKEIRDGVKETVGKSYLKERIHDNLVVFRRLKPGLGMPIYFYRNDDRICTLNDISGIKESLEIEAAYSPFFYVYILMDKELSQGERESILKDFGTCIGKRIAKKMLKYILK